MPVFLPEVTFTDQAFAIVAGLRHHETARSAQTRYAEFADALSRGDVVIAQAAGADFSTVVIVAGGNRELQALVDQVVIRSSRMLTLSASSELWAPWVDGYREVLELLERGDRDRAAARYREIYGQYRAAVEKQLWSGSD